MARTHENYQLAEEDRQNLEAILRSPKSPQSLVLRTRIVLLCGAGQTAEEVAAALGTSLRSVYKWRKRFKESQLDGLKDLPRSGQPKKLTEEKVKEVLRLTVERIPREATHWSVRLMAKAAGITTWQVQQIWQAADLKPHRLKTFKISNDPEFAEKVVDVVGLYMNPPDNAVVLSVDEKTQIQALDRTQPMLPLKSGQIERRTHDYKRHGTTNLYAAFNILTGEVIGRTTTRHRAKEFLDFLRQVERSTPKELALHLIMDNSSTHKTQDVQKWLEKHPRITVHFTPTSASWLNAVESWFSQLERRSIHRGVFTSVKELRAEIHRFIAAHNAKSAKPFKWTKSAATILDSVQRAKQAIDEQN
ncbi:MAG: IS630 family transposase [Deltaproteobacteria bacterium]|nr:IS630 family transposase [Deltaproteobacteria bacterium]